MPIALAAISCARGETPMRTARDAGHLEIVELLQRNGATR